MAKLPNVELAVLDLRKITNYCLSPIHPRGRHKARVFRNALDLSQNDAEWLRAALLEGIRRNEATDISTNAEESRWRVDIPLTRHGKSTVVRTIWIVQSGEQIPRLVTCWIR
jgi:hypothetical protein